MIYKKLNNVEEFSLLKEIDRSEIVKEKYILKNNSLVLVDDYYNITSWIEDEVNEYINRMNNIYNSKGIIIGAFDNDKVVGIGALDKVLYGKTKDKYKLDLLYINHDYRGQGIGKHIVNLFKEEAKKDNIKSIYISATPFKNTMDFYLGLGATLTNEIDEELFKLEPEDIHLELDVNWGDYLYKILLIEDDLNLSKNISITISKWNYEVNVIHDFKNIFEEFLEYNPDLVLLDITLPFFDGFYWCKKIREVSHVPIIFLSSRDSNMDIIMAVNMGADDFISKPFSSDILLAKIQAILRRTYSYKEDNNEIIEVNSAILNLSNSTISYENNQKELTKNEFKILQILMKNQGHIVSRDKIMRFLWDNEYYISENTLTVNINRLRKSLEDIGLIDFIITKKAQGYMIKWLF